MVVHSAVVAPPCFAAASALPMNGSKATGAGSPDREVGSLSVRHVQRSVPAPAGRSRRIVINAACQRLLCARRYDSQRAVGINLQKGTGSPHGYGTARAATRAGSLHRDSSRLRLRVFLDGNFEHAVTAGRIDVLRIGRVRQNEAPVKAALTPFPAFLLDRRVCV